MILTNQSTIFLKFDEKYGGYDIDKAFYYFSLAAKQNHLHSLFILGIIYESKKYINKAIYYYTANLYCPYAQLNLGLIYNSNEYGKMEYISFFYHQKIDLDKAILFMDF